MCGFQHSRTTRITCFFIVFAVLYAGAVNRSRPESRPEKKPSRTNLVADDEREASVLLQDGHPEKALKRALLAQKADSGRPSIHTLLGDIYLRFADFETAESYYRSALEIDPSEARAWLGLGRIDLLNFCRQAAREKFARAYALNPHDPQIVYIYASNAGSIQSEIDLLKRFIGMRAGQTRQDLESAQGRLIVREKTESKALGVLASRYEPYQLPLYSSGEGTWVLHVSINEQKPLRLILDTGARGIVISAAAARHIRLQYLVRSALAGFGNSSPVSARTALAETVRIGELTYRNCAIDVSERSLSHRADGVIGSTIFWRFLVSLDIPRRAMELTPFDDASAQLSEQEDWCNYDRKVPLATEQSIPISQIKNILLIPTQIKGAGSGYFMLDTGASTSSVSKVFTPNVNLTPVGAAFMFHGASGDVQNIYRAFPFELRFANRSFAGSELIALDLDGVSNQEGVKISGIIGSPMLSRSKTTINYRDGLLNVEESR